MAKAVPKPSLLKGINDGQPHSLVRLAGRILQWLTSFPSQARRERRTMATNFAPCEATFIPLLPVP
jgi:hypothetical protein